jgi:hypothetical protein
MLIGLMTGAPGESRFLLEDASILIFFELPAPRLFESASRLCGWLKQKVSFPRETNRRPVACHQYKARRCCTHCVPSFLALAFLSSIAFTIYCSMADTTGRAPAALVASSANADDSGHDSRMESIAMATSSSPTHDAAKMAEGEIMELTDFFKKMTVTEDDR